MKKKLTIGILLTGIVLIAGTVISKGLYAEQEAMGTEEMEPEDDNSSEIIIITGSMTEEETGEQHFISKKNFQLNESDLEAYKGYQSFTINRNIITRIIDESGTPSTRTTECLSTRYDLKTQEEDTSKNCISYAGEDRTEKREENISAEQELGVSFQECRNVYDMLLAVTQSEGFNVFDRAHSIVLNDDFTADAIVYYFNEMQDVEKKLLSEDDGIQQLASQSWYVIGNASQEAEPFITFFAMIRYQKDGTEYVRTLDLEICAEKGGTTCGGGCTCGHETMTDCSDACEGMCGPEDEPNNN